MALNADRFVATDEPSIRFRFHGRLNPDGESAA